MSAPWAALSSWRLSIHVPAPVVSCLGRVLTQDYQDIMQLSSAPGHRWHLNYASSSQGACHSPISMSNLPASVSHFGTEACQEDRVVRWTQDSTAFHSTAKQEAADFPYPFFSPTSNH